LDSIVLSWEIPTPGNSVADRAAIFAQAQPVCKPGHTRAVTTGAGEGPTLAVEHGPDTGLVVVGEGFPPGERITVLVKTIGGVRHMVVDQDGAFRVEVGLPASPAAAGLWVTATGDGGSRATLVVPRPSRLH